MSSPTPGTPVSLNEYFGVGNNSTKSLGIGVKEKRVSPVVARAQTVPRVVGRMNRTEAAFAKILEADRLAGRNVRWDFEPVKLRLADMTYLTPDFRVILPDGVQEFLETKGGFVREDAWIKLKLAAELHPYVFKMAQLRKGAWTIRTV